MNKLFLSAFVAAVAAVSSSQAQLITNRDTAANYGGAGEPGWSNGANAGSGFAAWNLYTGGGSAGNFLGSATNAGFGNIDTDGQSFGMWGNPSGSTNYFNAERAFSSALGVGNTFSVDLAIAFRNGNKGIDLYAGGFGSAIWNFNVGGDNYVAGGTTLTNWAYSQTSIFQLTATQTSATQVSISLIRGADTYSTNIVVASGLSGFKAYVGSTEAGNDLNNLFMNNVTTVVPEPSTYALLGLSALAVGGYMARRRARK